MNQPKNSPDTPPHHEHRRLQRARRVATIMDDAFRIPGTKFRIGLDSLIGLIPGIGDLATGVAAIYILQQASQLNVPKSVRWRMMRNIAIDALAGTVPLLGDVVDVGFKSNRRNVQLIEEHLAQLAQADEEYGRKTATKTTKTIPMTDQSQ